MLEFGWELFKQTMPNISKIKPGLQDESLVSYYDSSKDIYLGDRSDFTIEKSRLKSKNP